MKAIVHVTLRALAGFTYGAALCLLWVMTDSSAGHGSLFPLTIIGSPLTVIGPPWAMAGSPILWAMIGALWNRPVYLRVILAVHFLGMVLILLVEPTFYASVPRAPLGEGILTLSGYGVGTFLTARRARFAEWVSGFGRGLRS